MSSDVILKDDGMRILSEHLGLVEAERFIVLMNKEHFDYTQWRKGLFKGVPLKTFLENAQKHREKMRRSSPSRKAKAAAKPAAGRRKAPKRLAHI